jgi:hypothetical protein
MKRLENENSYFYEFLGYDSYLELLCEEEG